MARKDRARVAAAKLVGAQARLADLERLGANSDQLDEQRRRIAELEADRVSVTSLSADRRAKGAEP